MAVIEFKDCRGAAITSVEYLESTEHHIRIVCWLKIQLHDQQPSSEEVDKLSRLRCSVWPWERLATKVLITSAQSMES